MAALGEADSVPQLGDKKTEYFDVPADISPEKLAKKIRAQDVEISAIFDQYGALLSVPHMGGKEDVRILPDEEALIRNSIWIHNHPQGKPPSLLDLEAIDTFNPAEMWISSKSGVLKLIRPDGGWPNRAALVFAHAVAQQNASQVAKAEEHATNKARVRRALELQDQYLREELGKLGVEVKFDDHA